ncbi:MAG: hypothetical protein AB1634_14395 [Thermodesulfobacteriota bacterium]
MPLWRKKDELGVTPLYMHLCERCNERLDDALLAGGWVLVRDGEPVSCNACRRRCGLTSQGLWGEADAVRFAVCAVCPDQAPLSPQGALLLLTLR